MKLVKKRAGYPDYAMAFFGMDYQTALSTDATVMIGKKTTVLLYKKSDAG